MLGIKAGGVAHPETHMYNNTFDNAQLLAEGRTHLIFIQDTNALVFGGVPAALGVSVRHKLALNSISVPRKAGDAAGGSQRAEPRMVFSITARPRST